MPGQRHAKSTLDPGDLMRALRSETKGQAGACPDWTRPSPATCGAETRKVGIQIIRVAARTAPIPKPTMAALPHLRCAVDAMATSRSSSVVIAQAGVPSLSNRGGSASSPGRVRRRSAVAPPWLTAATGPGLPTRLQEMHSFSRCPRGFTVAEHEVPRPPRSPEHQPVPPARPGISARSRPTPTA